jgi:gluconolactonase
MWALATAAFIVVLLVARPQAPAGIPGVVAPGISAELVQEGFKFLEGPVGTTDGGLYFTDILTSKIHRLDPNGRISVVREPSGAANGLVVTRDGDLLAAEMTGKRVSKRSRDGAVTTISDSAGGNPYMAPNDLIADARGGIYFTDPGPHPAAPGRTSYVYYLAPGAKEPVVIDDQIVGPNGLTLTPDGKTLIVSDTKGEAGFAYDLQSDGAAKNKRIFTKLRDIPTGKESLADGIAVDRDGRLYVTTRTGVQVFGATGVYLGTIQVPRRPANVAFSGPGKRTLYITARDGLYRLETLTQGPDRPGK